MPEHRSGAFTSRVGIEELHFVIAQSLRAGSRDITPRRLRVGPVRKHIDDDHGRNEEGSGRRPRVARLAAEGHRRCAILGGGAIYGQYLGAGVVDELHLTVEPLVFGSGVRLAGDAPIDAGFRLRDVERLNESTLFLTYERK